jgi:hypothetical protein
MGEGGGKWSRDQIGGRWLAIYRRWLAKANFISLLGGLYYRKTTNIIILFIHQEGINRLHSMKTFIYKHTSCKSCPSPAAKIKSNPCARYGHDTSVSCYNYFP